METAYRIEFVTDDWERMDRIHALNWAVLYRDFGVSPDDDWQQPTPDSIHAVALSGRHALLGSLRLMGPVGDPERQLRQLAVEPLMQGQGIGSALVRACETRAAEQGCEMLWLNARDTAIAFYTRLGYESVGAEFVSHLTGIPHVRMEKRLQVLDAVLPRRFRRGDE